MARAAIMAVDDDPVVLNAVERDLRQKYGRDHRVLTADSGASGLEVLRELCERGDPVALLVVDQRMPGMAGVEFIEAAAQLLPDVRKVLLTAYADTEAAIDAINRAGVDYYLLKPWDPPSEHLYPVLDGLLEEWHANVEAPFDGIRVIGAMWSSASHEVKDFLARSSIPYRWMDVDTDPAAQATVEELAADRAALPVLLFPEGLPLVSPSTQQIAERVGLSTRPEAPLYDVVIIGGGPAGLSAAVYASADGLKVLLIERQAPGGQAGNSPKIENFLGFPAGISGGDLTRRAVTQARRFGTEILTTQGVADLRVDGERKLLTLTNGEEVAARIVLISTGAWFRQLDLPGIERWNGAGVYYGAAHTEAANYRDRDVVVVGAANSAAQGMLFLARYASSVTVLIRGDEPTWSRYLDLEIRAEAKITLRTNHVLSEIRGESAVESVVVRERTTNEESLLPAEAIFVFIGQEPQSEFVRDLVQCTESGQILTGLELVRGGERPSGWTLRRDPLLLETSVPGIFAAGDVRNGSKHGVAAATGDGNTAVSSFWQYLATT